MSKKSNKKTTTEKVPAKRDRIVRQVHPPVSVPKLSKDKPAVAEVSESKDTKSPKHLPTARQLATVCRQLSSERRKELYRELLGHAVPGTATVTKVAAAIGKKLLDRATSGEEIPSDVVKLLPSAKRRVANGGVGSKRGMEDPRVPSMGTHVKKLDREGKVRAECIVRKDGIEYKGKIYGSMSGAAMAAAKDLGMKSEELNGFAFWGLTSNKKAA